MVKVFARNFAIAATLIQAPVAAIHAQQAQQSSGPKCVLHVYGAITAPRIKQPQTTLILRYDGFMRDMQNPALPAYYYNPTNRIRSLGDQELRRLLPDSGNVEIVRHDELFNWDVARQLTFVSASPPNGCHAEFILSDVTAIYAPDRSAGVIADSLIGGSRMVANFTFRRVGTGTTKPINATKRLAGRLPGFATLQSTPVLYDSAMQRATSEAFASFVAKVVR